MFRIKICGVTSIADARMAVDAGADAVGLNFCRRSPRYLEPEAARPIVDAVRRRATPVGVFVNTPPAQVEAVCRELGIEVVQLSGDEPPEDAQALPFVRIKAIRIGGGGDLASCRDYPCDAFLLDAHVPGEYGGTGKTLEWGTLARNWEGAVGDGGGTRKPWYLAGGLRPENVLEAISLSGPYGVDVASGVERAPGRKDPGKVALFIQNAKEGLAIAKR